MKATELMIGDWVKDKYKPQPHRVDSWADFNSSEDLSPIPLTPEILEKNGFHYFPSATPHYYLESVDVLLNKEQGRRGYYTNVLNHRIFINYVHELQHALRHCRLNDLAGNFIV